MAAGEYISVASQKDTELADVDKERKQQEAGPRTRAHELEELAQIYVGRGLDYDLAKKVSSLHPGQSVVLRRPRKAWVQFSRCVSLESPWGAQIYVDRGLEYDLAKKVSNLLPSLLWCLHVPRKT